MSLPESHFSFLSADDHLLLFGSTGLFGHHLLPKLQSYFSIVDTSKRPLISLVTRNRQNTLSHFPYLKEINVVESNFLQSSSLNLQAPPTHVLHMANVSASDTFNGISQHLKYRLLSNSVEALRSVVRPGFTRKIIFTSSGVAYGLSDSCLEDQLSHINVLDPSFSLGFAKLNAEYLLSSLCSR